MILLRISESVCVRSDLSVLQFEQFAHLGKDMMAVSVVPGVDLVDLLIAGYQFRVLMLQPVIQRPLDLNDFRGFSFRIGPGIQDLFGFFIQERMLDEGAAQVLCCGVEVCLGQADSIEPALVDRCKSDACSGGFKVFFRKDFSPGFVPERPFFLGNVFRLLRTVPLCVVFQPVKAVQAGQQVCILIEGNTVGGLACGEDLHGKVDVEFNRSHV